MASEINPTDVIRADFDRLAVFEEDTWSHNSAYHAYLLRHAPPRCDHSLDVGCGTGTFARLLAQRSTQVYALDLAPEMIRVAQARSGMCPNITYQVADVLAWDWPAAQFDCIASIATLHHLPLDIMLAKMAAALRPGGVLLVLDLFQGADWRDWLVSGLALPVSLGVRLLKNGRWRESEAARRAWAQHGPHDVYLPLAQIRQACAAMLPGAIVRRHLLWRYSIVWRK